MDTRETLGSRLGFILLSAGCAIGIGNVWRFPYIVGQYGGGLFVLIYVIFLMILGIPLMTMEYSVGRASRRSIYPAFKKLEKPGTKWHLWGWVAMAGNYVLLFFYSIVSGWILYYAYLMAAGEFISADKDKIDTIFGNMMGSPAILITSEVIVVLITAVVCGIGLQKSVESVSKIMMIALLVIMVILGIRSLSLPGASAGLSFYLKPDLAKAKEAGIGNVMYAALNQSFFTLSIGMGGMEIYGSYIDKKKSLIGEASIVTALDTFVAFVAGLIIFPACMTYGVEVNSGPSLIFKTLPLVFANMAGGRIWGTLFFIFLFFAALSTMIGVFENDQAFLIDLGGIRRQTAAVINGLVIGIMSIPCALGFNVWSNIQPLRAGNSIMDLEDFFVSEICLPVGSLIFCLFCTRKLGWGFDNFLAEANQGDGWKISRKFRGYLTYVLPLITGFLILYGFYTYFA